jgi:hypothetical protein
VTGTLLDRAASEGGSTRFGGLGLDAVLTLRESHTVRPYLLVGAGAYRLREVPRAARGTDSETTAALVGGAGLLVRLGAASAFAEGRYTAFPGAAARPGYVPVVVGLRFGRY